ncbi:TetR family transcriptional regulator [Leucobacter sp. Psy1]|uniref:TetR/AcrR family transcriptional regulator n=1 Tax=Leucobacter sp. Psy1 TaxID=2875729 RepID=UPI001CD67659|nr:TetR/AcrR family transcriptional regulator [Leucobacter sp. Psy1]UBH06124.1 TetR family transcriptional regulator [Leucobacter sp. Psy1]
MPELTARDRILTAAARRFAADGIIATGIDAVIAEAGVAKMSLYNNFSSKAALVGSYIEARHHELLDFYARRVATASTPAESCLALFDAYLDHAESAPEATFRGCGLLNAASEFPAGDPARAVVREHKEEIEAILLGHLAEVVGEEQASGLAEHLVYVLEGAMSRAGLDGATERISRGRTIAAAILRAELPAESR